jgi:hypothetical protein
LYVVMVNDIILSVVMVSFVMPNAVS